MTPDKNSEESTNQRTLFPDPAAITGHNQRDSGGKWNRTNVFRESKEAILLTSIPDRFCLEKTRLPFACNEYHMQCYGLSMDPAERAICEFSPAIRSLKGYVRFYVQH